MKYNLKKAENEIAKQEKKVLNPPDPNEIKDDLNAY